MRYWNEKVLEEIKRELAFIFAAHRVHRLEGKMRLFSVANQEHWKSHESGFEFWFGPGEIEQAVNKIQLFYRGGNLPNTAFLLDPVLYDKKDGEVPVPVGSGVVWGTVLCANNEEVPEDAIKRVRDLGVFVDTLHYANSQNAGVKMLGFLKEPAMPKTKEIPQDGSVIPGIQSLSDLININSNAKYSKHYLLSGLEYRVSHGSYQHPSFVKFFGDKEIKTSEDIKKNEVHLKKIRDAGMCWNAYDRSPSLYERYGVDIANLEHNLKSKVDTDRGVEEIRRELTLIWKAHARHGLKGEMRLYTYVSQEKWRAKERGLEIWFGPNDLDEAARQLKLHYNGGLLPNSPLLLDPVVYSVDEEGNHVPLGTGIIWSMGLALGSEKLDTDAFKRLTDMNILTAPVKRGSDAVVGIKMLGFLDKPHMFDAVEDSTPPEDIEVEEDSDKREVEEKIKAVKKDDEAEQKREAMQKEKLKGTATKEAPAREPRRVLCPPGSRELFNIVGTSGEPYWNAYLLSGLEYLCGHGSFINEELSESFGERKFETEEDIAAYPANIQTILNGDTCWTAYDRHHSLWERFGIDVEHLETNLKYFNLCARDFGLLDALEGKRDDQQETFDFFVPGWVPRGAVTLVAATAGTGKSSISHRLSILSAIDWKEDESPLWLGSPIKKENCTGLSVYFSGEDGAAIVRARSELFDHEDRAKRFMMQRTDFGTDERGEERNLASFLKNLHKLPDVSVVVIDPARKYLEGNEDDAEVVSNFFEAIEEFAITKNCAMIVVHHLAKGAKPANTLEVLDCLRGSQVFIDRPRVVIGMTREGPHTIVGLAKNNIPPSMGMVEGERVFVRDPDNLDLLWLPGPEGVRSFVLSEEELEELKMQAQAEKELKEKTGKDG